MEEGKLVVIKPIIKDKFAGLSSYPKSVSIISTEMAEGGLYKTGLTKEEESHYEDILGLTRGTLAKKPASKNETGENFWSNLEIRVPLKGVTLNTANPLDMIRLKVAQESSKVANSEAEKHKSAGAQYFIVDAEADARAEEIEIDYEVQAFEALMNTSEDQKKGLLKLFGKTKGLESASASLIKTTLAKEIKKDPKGFLKVITDKNLETKILVQDLIDSNIITRTGNYFTNGDDPIGETITEVVLYLQDPKRSAITGMLKGKLKNKKETKTKE